MAKRSLLEEPAGVLEDGTVEDDGADAPWRRRFAMLRLAALDPERPRAARSRRPRRAWFGLCLDESWRAGQLVVAVYQQEQDLDGRWGPIRPFAVRQEGAEGFSEDGPLLGLLQATAPTLGEHMRLAGKLHRADRLGDAVSFVPALLHASVLPRLCAGGRFFVAGGEVAAEPDAGERLSWDGGSPWTFAVALELRGDARAALTGRLRRGEARRPLAGASLLVDGAVLFDRTLAPFDAGGQLDWIWELRRQGDVEVAESQLDAMLDDLWNLPRLPAVEMPPEWPLAEVAAAPRPRLRIHTPRSPRATRLEGTLFFDYEGRRVAAHDRRRRLVDRAGARVLARDDEAEEAAFDRLLELGAETPDDQRPDRHVAVAPDRLSRLVLGLIADGWPVEADGRPLRRPLRLRFAVSSGIDWFELRGEVDFEGVVLVLPELLAAIRREERLVALGDGSRGILPEEWIERYTPLAEWAAQGDDGALRFAPGEAVLLEALLETADKVEADHRFACFRERLRSFARIEPCREPPGFLAELRPYQREGLAWLRFLADFGFGGCLADDMGLGKTVQVLALLEHRRRDGRESSDAERRPSLVVVPRSLVHNWIHEAARFAPSLRVLGYGGPGRRVWLAGLAGHDLVVTTYGTLRRDADELAEVPFDYVVLDEAQAIKNVGGQTAKACRRLKARHRLALTGTPVENHLGELWSIMAFLNPGLLGRLPALGRVAGKTRLDDASLAHLARALRPFILRRTKQAVLRELPPKSEQVLFCDLGETQQKLYDELRDHYRVTLAHVLEERGLDRSKVEVLEALLRLRQAACHPGLIDPARTREKSAKLGVALDHLDELVREGHKALVFSQFTSFLAILRPHLDARGAVYEYLDGATRDRQERVDRFQRDEGCQLFLISLKAGGVGLNLTAADYVFLLDPWWNPAVEAQAIDRAHRFGQERPVFAYRLISRDTVEEKILRLQEKKRDLADAILAADAGLIRTLTSEDLRWLLS